MLESSWVERLRGDETCAVGMDGAAPVAHTRSVTRPIPIPGVVVLCAAMLAFPPKAVADTTLTPRPDSPAGSVFVKSPSGEAKCVITVDDPYLTAVDPDFRVMCALNPSFPVPDWVNCDPLPAVDVVVNPDGELEYGCGGNGFGLNADPAWFQTLEFGTTYAASGWSFTPINTGLTFTNSATGHGMTFTPQGVNAF